MTKHKNPRQKRRGATALMTTLLLVPLLGAVALAIDLGFVAMSRSELQAAADSSALAGGTWIFADKPVTSQNRSRRAAVSYAAANYAGNESVVLDPATDITYGWWNVLDRELEPPREDEEMIINAIRVRLHRDASNSTGPIRHFLAPFLGIDSTDLVVEAIAYIPNPGPSSGGDNAWTRFLIDNEMFDPGLQVFKDLATELNVDPDKGLLSSRLKEDDAVKNKQITDPTNPMTLGDPNPDTWNWKEFWFMRLSYLAAGRILEVPTGEVGDEGLLDLSTNLGNPDLPQYPFHDQVSHTKMLRYSKEGGSNGTVPAYQKSLLTDSQLDPVHGVGRFNQPGEYPLLVNPDFVHVSPVYKSDISAQNGVINTDPNNGPDIDGDGDPDGVTTNELNTKGSEAKGERRGLVAFRILGVVMDPSQPYPDLPKLRIELIHPDDPRVDLNAVMPSGGETDTATPSSGGAHNIRLVR